jgi:hypothetical protein
MLVIIPCTAPTLTWEVFWAARTSVCPDAELKDEPAQPGERVKPLGLLEFPVTVQPPNTTVKPPVLGS